MSKTLNVRKPPLHMLRVGNLQDGAFRIAKRPTLIEMLTRKAMCALEKSMVFTKYLGRKS